jgi:hypothetical protein
MKFEAESDRLVEQIMALEPGTLFWMVATDRRAEEDSFEALWERGDAEYWAVLGREGELREPHSERYTLDHPWETDIFEYTFFPIDDPGQEARIRALLVMDPDIVWQERPR